MRMSETVVIGDGATLAFEAAPGAPLILAATVAWVDATPSALRAGVAFFHESAPAALALYSLIAALL